MLSKYLYVKFCKHILKVLMSSEIPSLESRQNQRLTYEIEVPIH